MRTMKKSIIYYLFAVVCTVCLFTACDDDDDNTATTLTVDNIVGTYTGTMDITLAGATVADDLATSITVAKVSSSSVTVSLSNFTITGVLETPVDIQATCTVTSGGDDLNLSGSTTVSIMGLEVPVTVTGDSDGKELDLDIAVTTLGVTVDFDGTK